MTFSSSSSGLLFAIFILMVILPIYFAVSPLRFDSKSKFIWFVPLINAILFLLTARLVFNNSADAYLLVYIPLSYLAILIKIIYKYCRH